MTYRIKVNGSLVQPSDEMHWGLDTFEGRRIIPSSRDMSAHNSWGAGINAIPGPPESSFFKLSFWVVGDGNPDTLETRIDQVMHFFRHMRHRANFDFEWESHETPPRWNHCKARIISVDVVYEHDAHNARVNLVMENLGGVWRDTNTTSKTQGYGQSLQVNEGDAGIYDAKLYAYGPFTGHVQFQIGTRWVRWTGTLASGDTLQIDCSPLRALKNEVLSMSGLSWYGSEGRGLDIYPGESLTASVAGGADYSLGSQWSVSYRNVRY